MRFCFLCLLLIPRVLFAQINISNHDGKGYPIAQAQSVTSIYFDMNDAAVVGKAAEFLASDIKAVSGKKPVVIASKKKIQQHVIIIGTIGKNSLIDQLISKKKIDVYEIENKWERFLIQTVKNPMRGVDQALVIVGSDQRGTAYGVFSLSEAMGVSPWYYWADVPVQKNKLLYLLNEKYVSKAPTVKYRGVFLNDEDWGLHPWAASNMDPEVNSIGPNTYEKIFELLLRLKANMFAPAMHECTKAFYTVPGNMEMAHKYGIMVTTSHCEPLLYNNASEWDKNTQGEWNYKTNRVEMERALENRVIQAHNNDNIYTIALRGMHDEGMKGGSDKEKLETLAEAIKHQRSLLTKYIDKPIDEIPQIFVPYKEVLGLYEQGLQIPEDITIVWPDDNYGYIKRMSNAEELGRKGGAGVYYHLSYLGWPNDYLWLNTTPPALMYAEMHKAYSLGANKYWLVNVGDIKPGEMGMQLFLDMAWDMEQFNFDNINDYQVNMLTSFLGEEYKEDLTYILDRYYYHGFTRKPEYMTGDWVWNSLFDIEKVKDTDFSFVNYKEADRRLNDYKEISNRAFAILESLPEDKKAAFFQWVYYPVKGASLYNHEMLIAQKNRWYAKSNRALTNVLARDVSLYHDSLAMITEEYNNLLNGKWNGMMTAPGFLPRVQLPPTENIVLKDSAQLAVFVEGQLDNVSPKRLPEFVHCFEDTYFIEIYNRGKGIVNWNAKASEKWIQLSEDKGAVKTQDRIKVSIDWDLFPNVEILKGLVYISDGNQTVNVEVSAVKNQVEDPLVYIENNGVISINPAKFHRKNENGTVKFQKINGLGYCNSSLQLGNALCNSGEGSFVEYDFYVNKIGEICIHTLMLPLFAKDKEHGTRYGVQVDDQEIMVIDNDVKEYSRNWAKNVMRNTAINKSKVFVDKLGKHTLKVYSVDPGMIIQKIMIDTGGLKNSYVGPVPMK